MIFLDFLELTRPGLSANLGLRCRAKNLSPNEVGHNASVCPVSSPCRGLKTYRLTAGSGLPAYRLSPALQGEKTMANIAKAKRLQAHGLIDHDTRSCENHTNEKIRPELSHLNYNLVPGDPWDNYCRRMSQVFCRKRADINTLVQIAVTLPVDVNPLQHEKFFRSVTAYYQNYFGAENVISAIVHLDETTPHLHIKAIPVYHNTKKDRDQVSFDVKCPRKFYQTMHSELEEWVSQEMGYRCGIQNEATREGNKSVKQLKALTATKEVKELQEMLSDPQKRLSELQTEINQKEIRVQELKTVYGAKKGLVEEINGNKLEFYPQEVKQKRSLSGKESVEVPKQLWEKRCQQAQESQELKKRLKKVEGILEAAEQGTASQKYKSIVKENTKLKIELKNRPTQEAYDRLYREADNLVKDYNSLVDEFKQVMNWVKRFVTGLIKNLTKLGMEEKTAKYLVKVQSEVLVKTGNSDERETAEEMQQVVEKAVNPSKSHEHEMER
jgi:hypothetical protein